MYVLEPQLQVRNDCLLLYNLPTVTGPKTHIVSRKKAYSGQVTQANTKRLRKAIDILVQQTQPKTTWNPVTKKHFPFRLNFVTLTVSDRKLIDTEFSRKNLLEPFLRKMRSMGVLSYVWKAEYQARGQIHYHLITSLFLPWQEIRSTWNNLQRKNRLLDDYAKRFKSFDPNSTDVHAISEISNLAAYLSKYLSKTNSAKIKGKVWDCSTDLKRKRFACTPTHHQEMLLRKLQNDKHVKVIELDHCTLFKMKKPTRLLTTQQRIDYIKWLS